jgi:hypothetical protein
VDASLCLCAILVLTLLQQNEQEEAAENAKPPPAEGALYDNAAEDHGNKPSRGKEIDQEIAREEREILKKKGSEA